ncbi:MAG: hypothetical protein M3O34_05645 [Chloroflexota bacterium]|nr:hypothetical protein [Chloroflexota bacterium]
MARSRRAAPLPRRRRAWGDRGHVPRRRRRRVRVARDNEPAPRLLDEPPFEAGVVLGGTHSNDPAVRDHGAGTSRLLVATRRGRYPRPDAGVEVRRLFHQLRSRAIEHFHGQFKGIFDAHGPVPTGGLVRTRRFALDAVLGYQLTLLSRFEHQQDLRVGLQAFLRAARPGSQIL